VRLCAPIRCNRIFFSSGEKPLAHAFRLREIFQVEATTMAAIDAPNNSGMGLRREVTADELERAKRDYEEARRRLPLADLVVAGTLAGLGLAGLAWVIRRRSKLAAAADNAAVEIAARGLKAKRTADQAIGRFTKRVRDRADSG
jgi:hypothetical protein